MSFEQVITIPFSNSTKQQTYFKGTPKNYLILSTNYYQVHSSLFLNIKIGTGDVLRRF